MDHVYKVGDRVMVDGFWPGTITSIDSGGYWLNLDQDGGALPRWRHYGLEPWPGRPGRLDEITRPIQTVPKPTRFDHADRPNCCREHCHSVYLLSDVYDRLPERCCG
jgi:hypothetical protein